MSFCSFVRQTARPLWLVPFGLLGLVLLPGCQDTYNDDMEFPVRTDPLLAKPQAIIDNTSLGGVEEPDQPGQLPLSNLKNLNDPRNPFFVGLKDEHSSKSEDHDKQKKELEAKRERVKGAFFDPAALSDNARSALRTALNDAFGTPAAPKINPKVTGASAEQLAVLKLGKEKAEGQKEARDWLQEGGQLYRLHCMQCHGLTGDGRGPTARWVNPHPRDYRSGVFKFMSVNLLKPEGKRNQPQSPGYPRRADLFRTIKFGLEGTTMPAHNQLRDDEIEALVSYVIFLSIRGVVEGAWLLDDSEPKRSPKAFLFGAEGIIQKTLSDWYESQDAKYVIRPGPYKPREDSVRTGEKLFRTAGCAACHLDYGRRALFKLDEAAPVRWGILVRPANLTTGIFRGGRRPVDLYWRIHSGIPGSGMAGNTLSNEDIWDLVDFLHALPYPAMRRQHGLKVN